MSTKNSRGRKLVHMVKDNEGDGNNVVQKNEPITSMVSIHMELENSKSDNSWLHPRDVTLQQSTDNNSLLNLSFDGNIQISDYSFSKDESFSLFCNETMPSSLLCSPVPKSKDEDMYPRRDENCQEANFEQITATTEKDEEVLERDESRQEGNIGQSTATIYQQVLECDENRQEGNTVQGAATTELDQQVLECDENRQERNIEQNTMATLLNQLDLETDAVHSIQENEAEPSLTKKGTPRIRKRFTESLQVRKEATKQRKLEKFSVKPACTLLCKKKCTHAFSESDRLNINKAFWELNYEGQGYYIQSLVTKQQVARRLLESTLTRNNTYKYFFEKDNQKVEVCKIFFLTTLGYHQKNDRRILDALKKPLNSQADKRGKREHKEKVDRMTLKDHIESFRPAIAHYRRKHAPNRRYLPSDLNATLMYKDFIQKHPDINISYELYRQFLRKDMNISFTVLGNEECEECESFKLHKPSCQEPASCNTCCSYELHKEKYELARKLYIEDVELSKSCPDKAFYSADLQKVIMLPRIDMFKAVIFCPRLIAFNESFVPLGSTKTSCQPFAVLWHEAISGRKQEDIISTYRAFFLSKRDCTDLVVWTDNCSSQNKNWAFFTFLVQIINSSMISANTIIIKYLEPGHTFMSADNFHHQVENQLQKAKKVYDFSDFIDCVQLANSGKVTVKPMEVTNFFKYVDHSSQHKLKKNTDRIYLKDIVVVEARRNDYKLFVKTEYNGIIKELDFLKHKFIKSLSIPDPIQNRFPRGITELRKSTIISTLARKIIPENRLLFWQNLPLNDNALDLVDTLDVEDCDE